MIRAGPFLQRALLPNLLHRIAETEYVRAANVHAHVIIVPVHVQLGLRIVRNRLMRSADRSAHQPGWAARRAAAPPPSPLPPTLPPLKTPSSMLQVIAPQKLEERGPRRLEGEGSALLAPRPWRPRLIRRRATRGGPIGSGKSRGIRRPLRLRAVCLRSGAVAASEREGKQGAGKQKEANGRAGRPRHRSSRLVRAH